MEILYCNKWNRTEGLAALIITPTRELAYQIFETLRKIGIHHDFSAGLIIGKCYILHIDGLGGKSSQQLLCILSEDLNSILIK